MSAPIVPPAPGLLSTTTCWLSATESFCARVRPRMSVAPPAGNGISRRSGLAAGQAWARAASGSHKAAAIMQASSLFMMRELAGGLAAGTPEDTWPALLHGPRCMAAGQASKPFIEHVEKAVLQACAAGRAAPAEFRAQTRPCGGDLRAWLMAPKFVTPY